MNDTSKVQKAGPTGMTVYMTAKEVGGTMAVMWDGHSQVPAWMGTGEYGKMTEAERALSEQMVAVLAKSIGLTVMPDGALLPVKGKTDRVDLHRLDNLRVKPGNAMLCVTSQDGDFTVGKTYIADAAGGLINDAGQSVKSSNSHFWLLDEEDMQAFSRGAIVKQVKGSADTSLVVQVMAIATIAIAALTIILAI